MECTVNMDLRIHYGEINRVGACTNGIESDTKTLQMSNVVGLVCSITENVLAWTDGNCERRVGSRPA
jgi:hypothetical protein